jgi:perosamine synthetase
MIYKRIKQVLTNTHQALQSPYFGFIQGHAHLLPEELNKIKVLVGLQSDGIVLDFESQFAKLVGEGEAIAYAAARMAFYDLMRLLDISKGDEVVLLGATCAVMVNAVMRTGATPIFADIDPDTFGSSRETISACISLKTRMIVAQHSFGIPCNIEPIAKFAKEKNIFLLEDCALTLGSKVNGVIVGNFGDAALFSTDHSKPLSTLTGGLIYTRDKALARRMRSSQAACSELSVTRQQTLWRRFLLELHYCDAKRYGRMGLIDLLLIVKKKLINIEGDFLSEDFGTGNVTTYPYPAKLPTFLAAIGLIEINRWPIVADERSILLKKLIGVLSDKKADFRIPKAYTNKAFQIVPLRLAWSEPNGANVRKAIQDFVHVPSTWFMQPIISTNEPIENLGYRAGSCPISECIGPNMVNIPCNVAKNDVSKLIALFEGVYV